jgi:phosphate-selective porin OprO/OprP
LSIAASIAMHRSGKAAVALLVLLATAAATHAESPPEPAPAPAIDMTAEAGDADAIEPVRKLRWNEYDWKYSTFRFTAGLLVDYVNYGQDEDSKEQVKLDNGDAGLRDFRLLFKGQFKTERKITWTLGYMYDGATEEWRFRQTGIQVDVPELSGRVFVGRTKEGYSLVKVMVGYHGWGSERSPASDAFIPILADGIKWSGYHPAPHVFYQVGLYMDPLSETESFSTYDRQAVARVGWNPSWDDGQSLLHAAVMTHVGRPDGSRLQVRAKGGSFLGPYFIDTGKIPSDLGVVTGAETYYRAGPWLVGAEYNWLHVQANHEKDVLFHGGDAVVAWLLTGETRPYNAPGAFFEGISPRRSVFEGGPGAWEAVLQFSYADFTDEAREGGKYWRLTPTINWHMSDQVRTEFFYGYGTLDRFDKVGHTHFFQFRIQLTM